MRRARLVAALQALKLGAHALQLRLVLRAKVAYMRLGVLGVFRQRTARVRKRLVEIRRAVGRDAVLALERRALAQLAL